MESMKPSEVTTQKSILSRIFAKLLYIQVATTTGITPVDTIQKATKPTLVDDDLKKPQETIFNEKSLSESLNKLDEEFEKKLSSEAVISKLFAMISSVKSLYVELQYASSPYDVDVIQASDQLIVSELKSFSELKRCFLKKQIDPYPENTLVLAEIQEKKSLVKRYEIMVKKLESQTKLKNSKIMFLREKLEESSKLNRLLEKKTTQSCTSVNLKPSGLTTTHFVTDLRRTVKSIRSFVKVMIMEMKTAGWDIDSAVNSIEPGVSYYKTDDKCFAFEHFVCRVMFDGFHQPNFSLSSESSLGYQQLRFGSFNELKYTKPIEYLSVNPESEFGKFCLSKYLNLIHPKMESSFFKNMNQRCKLLSGELPKTDLFVSFAEMAKRVWLLHCLSLCFESNVSIFRVAKGCRFSEVYMENVSEEEGYLSRHRVAFNTVPGFRVGKTVIQCQVYLSRFPVRVTR